MPNLLRTFFSIHTLLFLIFACQSVFAQKTTVTPRFSHSLSNDNATNFSKHQFQLAASPIRIFAARVEFQPDEDTKTTGDGSFEGLEYMGEYGSDVIDPLPHNKAYFERKLQFLKHYFETTSDGKLSVQFTVSDSVYRLSKTMSEYAPDKNNDNLSALADMVQETWQMVDAQTPGITFSDYDCFVIFHAGVGRDIDLVSSIGVDPTPYDIPSITFNLKGLQEVYGASFNGFSVDSGQTLINHTLVLPQTESREIEAIGGDILQEISINGLLCASFGSYLGLPDLFNTSNGRSGIGRFGLMDGEGIFNYYGLLPPEPSAWERIMLGWASPVEINPSLETTLTLPALGLNQNPDSVIIKIPISSTEYFLLENRQRNPQNTGVTLTCHINGSDQNITFQQDEDDFSFYSIDFLKGDVIASTNYDWSIPGGRIILEDNSEIEVQGGLLIWHIDEQVIQNSLETNTINSGEIKGVRLLEADGSEDIGESYSLTDAGNGSESGTPLDYFYQGNPSPIYENRIDDSSYPNTQTNSGANSNLVFYDFSESGPVMQVKVSRELVNLQSLEGFPQALPDMFNEHSAITVYSNQAGSGEGLLLNAESGKLYPLFSGATFSFAEGMPGFSISDTKPAIDSDGNIFCAKDSTLFWIKGASWDSLNVGDKITTTPMVISGQVKVGSASGHIMTCEVQGSNLTKHTETQVAQPDTILGFAGDMVFTHSHVFKGTQVWDLSAYNIHRFTSTGLSEGWLAVVITTTNELIYLYSDGSTKITSLSNEAKVEAWPVIADFEHRDELCSIFPLGEKLYAFNENQFLISNFPIKTHSGEAINASPVVADVDGDSYEEIMLVLPNGRLSAYNRFGKEIVSFALSDSSRTVPAISKSFDGGLNLYMVDKGGWVQGWQLTAASQNIQWAELYAGPLNQNSYQPSETTDRTEITYQSLMPSKRVFNWPNPASNETRFRFYLTESANVELNVYDLTGRKIWHKNVNGEANLDNEVLWRLNNVQSGVYYGIVKATSGSRSEQVKLKIAIIK